MLSINRFEVVRVVSWRISFVMTTENRFRMPRGLLQSCGGLLWRHISVMVPEMKGTRSVCSTVWSGSGSEESKCGYCCRGNRYSTLGQWRNTYFIIMNCIHYVNCALSTANQLFPVSREDNGGIDAAISHGWYITSQLPAMASKWNVTYIVQARVSEPGGGSYGTRDPFHERFMSS